MSTNPTVSPGLLYHDAPAAIEWLCRAFGMQVRRIVPGSAGRIVHAHLTIGNGGVMVSSAEDYAFPNMCKTQRELGGVGSVEIIVHIGNPDEVHASAISAGAEILIPIEDKPYGGRGFSCKDPEGHVWAFGSYNPWASDA